MAVGRLIGIARRQRPRAAREDLRSAAVTVAAGVQGDFRGVVRQGKVPRRQVSLIEIETGTAPIASAQRAQ